MVDQRITAYVKQTLQMGYDIKTIRAELLKKGYSQDIVDESIKQSTMQTNYGGNDYAGFWLRFAAFGWDALILWLPIRILLFIIQIFSTVHELVFVFSGALLGILVTVFFESKGATPGKKILGLQIVNTDGSIIGIPKAILRSIGKIISMLILGIGFFMIGWSRQKQGLHDKIAGSFVEKRHDVGKIVSIVGIVLALICGIIIVYYVLFPILILVGAGAYYGVVNPDQILPNYCVLPPGFICEGEEVAAQGDAKLLITAAFGIDVRNLNVKLGGCSPDPNNPTEMANGETKTFAFRDCAISGSRFKSNILVEYTLEDSLEIQRKEGSVSALVG